jgi:tight adherence protein C
LRSAAAESAWARLADTVEKSGLNLSDTKEDELRKRLVAAGFPQPHATRLYTLIRLTMVVALPVLAMSYLWFTGSGASLMKLWVVGTVSALLGLYLPALFVRAKGDRRREELIRGFPDALDLMLVCVEAGLGLDAAFSRVGSEIVQSHPLLAEQYGIVTLELRAGRGREEALRRLADRAGVPEVKAFATLLIQSEKLGSSIAQTMRVYASEMREKRRMRAEEKAHRLPVLLSIPLVCFMLPTMIGVLMLPAIIVFLRDVAPNMGAN